MSGPVHLVAVGTQQIGYAMRPHQISRANGDEIGAALIQHLLDLGKPVRGCGLSNMGLQTGRGPGGHAAEGLRVPALPRLQQFSEGRDRSHWRPRASPLRRSADLIARVWRRALKAESPCFREFPGPRTGAPRSEAIL